MQAGTYVHPSTGDVGVGRLTGVKNRLINGAMQVDQRGGGACVGGSAAAVSYTVDRWACAVGAGSGTLVAGQVALNASDRAATGQGFAAAVGPAPTVGLAAYFPFDGDTNDASGNGVTMTRVGGTYVSGRVGSQAIYLANEANVTATPTKAANYLIAPFRTFTVTKSSISLWFLATKLPLSGQYTELFTMFIENTGWAGAIDFSYISTTQALLTNPYTTASYTININTWYHVVVIYDDNGQSRSSSLYINGSLIGTNTATSSSSPLNALYIMFGDAPINSGYNRPFAGFIDDFRIYNRALSVAEIAALANIAPLAPVPATTLASGLTTRLTFDNTTVDAQGTLAAPTGTPVYSTASKSGTACLDLTANTAGSTATNALTYALASGSYSLPLTISSWINASTVTTTHIPIQIGSSNGWAIQIWIDNTSKLYMGVQVVSLISAATSFTLTGTWYHVVLTANTASYLNGYVNGILAFSVPIPAGSLGLYSGSGTINVLRVGSQQSAAGAFKGLIDDVRIYNRALSPQEVAGLYYSYQPAPYVLYQQPIEGLNVADLGWGTSGAQPAAVSCWIKNNTSTAQQFSLSAGNAGAAAAITAITFESGIEDTLGYLTNPVGVNVSYSTSAGLYKVGTRALDLTANNAGGTASTYVQYNTTFGQLPLSVSVWVRPTGFTTGQYHGIFHTYNSTTNGFGLVTYNNGLYIQDFLNGTNYSTFSTLYTLPLDTWTHIVGSVSLGGLMIIYVNGLQFASVSLPSTTTTLLANSFPIINLTLGSFQSGAGSFRGYIDDVRIYNRALTATEVYQLYAKNATSTTISQYLLPRSYLYTTPTIAAGAWRYITFTVPGDTTDAAWATDTTCGINLALCLGAGGPYVGATSSGWASAKYLTGSNVQAFGGAATNFLASAGNSLLVTGVQLEKGAVATPFDVRPLASELQICMRYFGKSYSYDVPPGSTGHNETALYAYPNQQNTAQIPIGYFFKAVMRSTPTVLFYHPYSGAINQMGWYADSATTYSTQTPNNLRITDTSVNEIVLAAGTGITGLVRFHLTVTSEL